MKKIPFDVQVPEFSPSEDSVRIKAIKSRHVKKKYCDHCHMWIFDSNMWCVRRYTSPLRGDDNEVWHYCQHCMPTAQDVLNEIDTDEHSGGIYPYD